VGRSAQARRARVRRCTSTAHGTCGHAQPRPPQSHLRHRGAGARTALPPRSAQTATVAHAAWGSGRTHGPAAMLSPDRHSRTCGVGEVVARTALRPCSAQTATVAHAAQGRWAHARHCGHAQLRPPQSHLRRGGGGRTHGTAAMLSSDRHSRTCGVGERSHARHCGHGSGLRDGGRLGVALWICARCAWANPRATSASWA
jgi:hypothetical protein